MTLPLCCRTLFNLQTGSSSETQLHMRERSSWKNTLSLVTWCNSHQVSYHCRTKKPGWMRRLDLCGKTKMSHSELVIHQHFEWPGNPCLHWDLSLPDYPNDFHVCFIEYETSPLALHSLQHHMNYDSAWPQQNWPTWSCRHWQYSRTGTERLCQSAVR